MWFRSKQKQETPESIREIFSYWDGEKTRKIDPLVAWSRLLGDEEIDLLADLDRASELQIDAYERVCSLACKTFDVQEYSESGAGLTRPEIHKLVGSFFAYVNELKKKLGPMPLPLRCLVRKSSTEENSTTKQSVESCSQDQGSTPLDPCQS